MKIRGVTPNPYNAGILNMKFSTRTRYGLRFLIFLAHLPPGEHVQLHHVAERENISPGYLEQIVHILKSAGILNSIRGNGGGYSLKKPPQDITFEEIFHCLEGNMAVKCVCDKNYCHSHEKCRAKEFWIDFDNHIHFFLKNKTLADMLPQSGDIEYL